LMSIKLQSSVTMGCQSSQETLKNLRYNTLPFQALECAVLYWAVILIHSVCSVGKGRRPEIMV
jgi:hypothetical protein